jgi:hypothetical protein
MKIRSRLSKTCGSVLMVALFVSGLTGIALISYLTLLSTEVKLTGRSQVWNTALPLVEAGIEEAMAHITSSTNAWNTDGWTGTQWNVQLQRSLGDGYYVVAVTNQTTPPQITPVIVSRGYVHAPVSTGYISRAVRVILVNVPLSGPGLASKTTIDLNGNKLTVDSFDSGDPNYSDINGMYLAAKQKDGVQVASAAGFAGVVDVGGADVFGKVATAPGGSVDALKNATIGSLAFHAASKTGIEPGWTSDDADITFSPIVAPISGAAPTFVGTVMVLSNGVYEVGALNGAIQVNGDATLIVRTSFTSKGKGITIAPGAKLDIYNYADKAVFSGSGLNTTSGSRATNLRYYGMPSNTEVDFNGGCSFVGVIYAPDAAMYCNGGGGSVNIVGSTATYSVKMGGSYNFHFDEALLREAQTGWVIRDWTEL